MVDATDPHDEIRAIQALASATARRTPGWTPLHTAAQLGSLDAVRRFLDGGLPPGVCTGDGQTPLHLAAQEGHLAVVHLLMARGADAEAEDEHGMTPVQRAAERGRTRIARFLREAGGPARAPRWWRRWRR
ncbi:MAG: ankyrin repeat domain-containing protein [Planctomycetota bacterium]